MLVITNNIVDKTIKHLNENYKLEEEVQVHFIPGYETIADANGEVGYYVFDKKTMEVFIPTVVLNKENNSLEDTVPTPYEVDSLGYKIGIIRRIANAYYNVRCILTDCERGDKDVIDFCDKIVRELIPENKCTDKESVND
jgi:hypothetical protein